MKKKMSPDKAAFTANRETIIGHLEEAYNAMDKAISFMIDYMIEGDKNTREYGRAEQEYDGMLVNLDLLECMIDSLRYAHWDLYRVTEAKMTDFMDDHRRRPKPPRKKRRGFPVGSITPEGDKFRAVVYDGGEKLCDSMESANEFIRENAVDSPAE